MKTSAALCLTACVFVSAGCVVNQKPKVAAVAPPPAPKPPPPAPLVFPQNTAVVPPSQPVPPDAVPPPSPGGLAMASETEVLATPQSPARTTVVTAPPKIEAAAPPPASAEIQTPLPQRQPSTLLSRSDRTRNRAVVEERIRQVKGVLTQLARQNFTGAAKDDRDRANSMIESAQQALTRGELRQADDLSSRAAILANTLINAR